MKTTFTILGGGIAGLTAAIALKKIGIDAMVMEAAPEFKPVGAGIVLAANAMRAYQYLGMYDKLVAAGKNVHQLTIYDDQGKVISKTATDGLKNSLANFAIHRASLHNVLLSQLDESRVITGKRSTNIVENDDGYTVQFDDASEVTSKYLIVAEGIHSATRKKVLPSARIRYSGYTCWRGITTNNSIKLNETFETWGLKGRFGRVPLADDKIYWFACKNARPNDEKMKLFGVEDLLENFAGYHAPVESIIQSTPANQIIWNDIADLEPINQYAFGNMVLIGDAAHATTPNMGQGACQAIEDAVILANCIKDNSSIKGAFKTFEQKRLKRTHYIVNQSWQLGKVAQLENTLLCNIRNFVFRNLPQKFYQKQVEKVYDIEFD